MQTQYIHPSNKPEDAPLAALIEAVAQKIREGLTSGSISASTKR